MTEPPAESGRSGATGPPGPRLRGSGPWSVVVLVLIVALTMAAAGVAVYSMWSEESEPTGAGPADEVPVQEIAERHGPAVWKIETSGCRSPGVGTAFAVGPRTLITHAHVVLSDPAPLAVSHDGDDSLRAEVVGVDVDLDVAVLETNRDLPGGSLDWADEGAVAEGDTLVALGHPVPGQSFAAIPVTAGEVRAAEALRLEPMLDKGTSGGPALTVDGQVAGMVTHLRGGDQMVPVALTYEHLAGAIEAIQQERAGIEVDCGEITAEPALPADWGWDDPRPASDAPAQYGDADELDGLHDSCRNGDMEACDQLYWRSSYGSEYESVAATCGGLQAEPVPGRCAWLAESGAFEDTELPWTFGDDPRLDELWTACEAGYMRACDELYLDAPVGSEYERFGATCGDTGSGFGSCELDREQPEPAEPPMTYGDDPYLDVLWDECEQGNLASCDALYFSSEEGSEYEEFGSTCGRRSEPVEGGCS